ncbi:hypothetical protein D3C79_1014590 [compost metagenome]
MPAVEQVGGHRNHHRQRADNHGGHRRPGALNGACQAQVIQQIADRRQFERLEPVFTLQLLQPAAIKPCQRQGDQAKGQVAPGGL